MIFYFKSPSLPTFFGLEFGRRELAAGRCAWRPGVPVQVPRGRRRPSSKVTGLENEPDYARSSAGFSALVRAIGLLGARGVQAARE